ncbi:MAG: hypothetical protein LC115_12545 [Bacteroidia bacterium]|nr:hypothetical protein [Bacteroidia bacterium]
MYKFLLLYMASLDPRINRVSLLDDIERLEDMDQWQTYEVFHQKSRGDQHTHVGIIHAPSPEMAMVFAKEQYARRQKCVNLWVVKTQDIYATDYDDQSLFEQTFDKSYREASGYKVRETINQFKKENQLNKATKTSDTSAKTDNQPESTNDKKFKLKPKQPKP